MTQQNEHLSPDAISAFVDGELAATDAICLQEHTAECHVCATRIVSAMRLKSATASAGDRFAASPDVLQRLAAGMTLKEPRRGRILAFRAGLHPAAWTALAATVLLVAALAGWQRIRSRDSVTAELLDQHLATLSSGAAPEVISTDKHTVKPWFQGKLPFSFNLPDTLPNDTALQGGDMTYLHGQPAALLLFTIHKHKVSVFITQRADRAGETTPATARSGFSIQDATTPGLCIVGVSDVNNAELKELVNAISAVQQSEEPAR